MECGKCCSKQKNTLRQSVRRQANDAARPSGDKLLMDDKSPCNDIDFKIDQRQYTHTQEFINNLPYIVMMLLGAAIFIISFESPLWAYSGAIAYLVYAVTGTFWIMVFICPYCAYWNTRFCPCGYGTIAAKFRKKEAGNRFNEKFRKNIGVIVPLWFIPLFVGVPPIIRSFSWWLLFLLAAFILDAFVILPLFSIKHGCKACPQKNQCPWMKPKTNLSSQ